MTWRDYLKAPRRVAVGLGLALALATFAGPVRADDPPKFSSPEVNEFVRRFGDLVDAYVKAVKAKDEGKMKELDARSTDLVGLSNTAEGKLLPEEAAKFGRYMTAQTQKLIDAARDSAK